MDPFAESFWGVDRVSLRLQVVKALVAARALGWSRHQPLVRAGWACGFKLELFCPSLLRWS